MIKVLYCVDYLVAGGVERQTTALITGLDRAVFQPEVVCIYGEKMGASLHFAPLLHEHDIPLHLLDLTHNPQSKLIAFLQMLRHNWRSQPHLFHTVNYHGNILAGWAHYLLPPRTRRIVSVRAENTPKQQRNQMLSWRTCRHIITNSPHLVAELTDQAGLPSQKITHIPNGLNVERFATPPDGASPRPPEVKRLIVNVVRITPRKVPEMLAQAVGMLKASGDLPDGVQAWIIGEREDATTQQQLEATIQEYDLQGIIQQYPQAEDVAPYYHAADFTVLVSLWGEGLPNVVLESLATGRPVVISEAANRVNIIEHGITGWVVRTNDVAHLAETLRDVLNMPESAMAPMREACRARAREYTMAKMIARHVAVYEAALHRPPAG